MNIFGYNDIKLLRKKGYILEENYWYVVKILIMINGIWIYIYVLKLCVGSFSLLYGFSISL